MTWNPLYWLAYGCGCLSRRRLTVGPVSDWALLALCSLLVYAAMLGAIRYIAGGQWEWPGHPDRAHCVYGCPAVTVQWPVPKVIPVGRFLPSGLEAHEIEEGPSK